ncbi:MAG: enoyl-CoA hydratase-related protein, partial [Bacteroidia bacterium]|nr:enoyl-CoA hydratase-related protein [Bacteroidia bacterium]
MSFILTDLKDQVMVLTLNRPDKFNSFNRDMAMQLQDALDKASADANVRAIVLTGSGKAFCA